MTRIRSRWVRVAALAAAALICGACGSSGGSSSQPAVAAGTGSSAAASPGTSHSSSAPGMQASGPAGSPLNVAVPNDPACRAVPSNLFTGILGTRVESITFDHHGGDDWCYMTHGHFQAYIMVSPASPDHEAAWKSLVASGTAVPVPGHDGVYDLGPGGYDGLKSDGVGISVSLGFGYASDNETGRTIGHRDAAMAAVSAFLNS